MGREESALLHSRLPTVFLVIPNYVYSSDFLRTDFIHALAGKFRIVVLLPMAADSYPRSPDIAYAPWRLQFPEFWTFWGKTIRVPLIRMFDHEPLIQRNYELSFGHWKRKLLRRLAFRLPFQLLDPRLQLRNFGQQRANNRLGFWRLASDDFFRDYRFHAHCCDTKSAFKSRSIRQEYTSGV